MKTAVWGRFWQRFPANVRTTPAALWRRSRKAAKTGLNLLYPPRCVNCDADLAAASGPPLCLDCRQRLVPAHGPACQRCGARIPKGFNSEQGCMHCQGRRLRLTSVVAFGPYEGALRDAILRMKHDRDDPLTLAMGEWLVEWRQSELEALRADVLAPIPMHWTRRVVRGTNSAELLAARLGRRLSLPSAAHLLTRRRRTRPQSDLSPGKRFDNLRGAFRLSRGYDVRGVNVALVDDILTTGATCNEAAKVLLKAGAAQVTAVVLARAEANA